jgi:hypothetical protein
MTSITEQLREQAWRRSGAPKMNSGHTKMVEWMAADEIERLHALCDNLSRIAISKEAALTDAEWVGYYFGLQRALNMKRLPPEFVSFLDHEMREVESKLPPGTIENWPKTKETE